MQIYLKFKCDNAVLPLSNKYQLQSLIYSMLSRDERYSSFLHNRGYASGNKNFKLFTFGNPYGKYEIADKNIIYPEGFFLQLRSPDVSFINAILHSVAFEKEYSLCLNSLLLHDFKLENRIIRSNRITVKTVSPITAYTTLGDGSTRYFSPAESEFYEAIKSNAVNKLSSNGIIADNFNILPAEDYTKTNKTVTVYKDTYITAWSGKFILEGKPEALNFLYNTGIGSKNSQGFGMFEISKEKSRY